MTTARSGSNIAHRSVTVLAAAVAFAAAVAAQSAAGVTGFEQRSSATEPHVPIRVLDTERMPIFAPRTRSGWGTKVLYQAPNDGGALRILYVPPGAEGAYNHYHEFHEWAYNIQGDFTNNESTMPDQVSGPLQRFREGNFLSRPPFSLHGGERGRMKHMASQIGAIILIMEESNVGAGTYTVDPAVRDKPQPEGGGMRYNPDYKKIQHWSTPRIIDTLEKMPWQAVDGVPGLNVKYLIDDPSHGFRANMWFLEAGAKTPERFRPHYYRQAHQMSFVINGDLAIDAYSAPGKKAESYKLSKHFFVERPPMSIFGLAPDAASQGGVVWLEVTYAKGTRWTDTPAPIEEPSYF
ncbi:MAG TPA: hypothetical protein VJ011_07625 [Steroidobacteraceae bacterium]|nr:hypothetical protein [Steroidobacteraceae bacterium]